MSHLPADPPPAQPPVLPRLANGAYVLPPAFGAGGWPAQMAAAEVRPPLTMGDLWDRYYAFKVDQYECGEVGLSTIDDILHTWRRDIPDAWADLPVATLSPRDFAELRRAMSEYLGPHGLSKRVGTIRAMFAWAWDMEMLDRPVRYGRMFRKASASALRRAAQAKKRTFTAAELRTLLDHPWTPKRRCFILLGINCGYGQKDIADLPAEAAAEAVETGLLRFPRPKTAIERECALWPETREMLDDCIRRKGRAFLTERHTPYLTMKLLYDEHGKPRHVSRSDPIGAGFHKVAKTLGIPRPGFYGLRRTFRTIADRSRDSNAACRAMGHEIPGMSGVYIERIEPDRLRAVADTVRDWLWPEHQ